MKILILTGSPRSKGTTSLLADDLQKGQKRQGMKSFVLIQEY